MPDAVTTFLPSMVFAGLLGAISIAPAILPADGQRLGIWVPPWSSSGAVLSKLVDTDARLLSVSDTLIMLDGARGLPGQLRAAGIYHAVSADTVLCGTRLTAAPRHALGAAAPTKDHS